MTSAHDGGLQPERTLLAWRRTALALGIASAILVRLLVESIGLAAIVVGIVGVVLAAAAYAAASLRYRRSLAELAAGRVLSGDGLPLALLTLALVCTASACAVFVLVP